MSEDIPQNPNQDQRFSPEMDPGTCDVVDLHGETLQLPPVPVIDRETALAMHGIKGDIVAVVNLPWSDDDPVGQGNRYKKIAVIDYGEIGEDPPYVQYMPPENRPIPFFGKVKSRFGTQALNYYPKDHGVTYSPLKEGRTIIGTSIHGPEVTTPDKRRKTSYRLGLHEEFAGNALISEDHFTITKDGDRLSITDHSTNGTQVVISKEL